MLLLDINYLDTVRPERLFKKFEFETSGLRWRKNNHLACLTKVNPKSLKIAVIYIKFYDSISKLRSMIRKSQLNLNIISNFYHSSLEMIVWVKQKKAKIIGINEPGFPPECSNWRSAFAAKILRSRQSEYIIGSGQLSSFCDDNNLQKLWTEKSDIIGNVRKTLG